jgi:hypothetical protein
MPISAMQTANFSHGSRVAVMPQALDRSAMTAAVTT